MRILALDAASSRCAAMLCDGDAVLAQAEDAGAHGQAARLPPLAAQVLQAGRPDAVAVVVGPGSFTGLRAAVALAHGLALGFGVPAVGVTVGEAVRDGAPAAPAHWVASAARRGFVFLDNGETIALHALDALPAAPDALALSGDAADAVAAMLAARNAAPVLTGRHMPDLGAVARIGQRRLRGDLPPVDVQPLYVEAPLVTGAAP